MPSFGSPTLHLLFCSRASACPLSPSLVPRCRLSLVPIPQLPLLLPSPSLTPRLLAKPALPLAYDWLLSNLPLNPSSYRPTLPTALSYAAQPSPCSQPSTGAPCHPPLLPSPCGEAPPCRANTSQQFEREHGNTGGGQQGGQLAVRASRAPPGAGWISADCAGSSSSCSVDSQTRPQSAHCPPLRPSWLALLVERREALPLAGVARQQPPSVPRCGVAQASSWLCDALLLGTVAAAAATAARRCCCSSAFRRPSAADRWPASSSCGGGGVGGSAGQGCDSAIRGGGGPAAQPVQPVLGWDSAGSEAAAAAADDEPGRQRTAGPATSYSALYPALAGEVEGCRSCLYWKQADGWERRS